jgi:hypothetical protein
LARYPIKEFSKKDNLHLIAKIDLTHTEKLSHENKPKTDSDDLDIKNLGSNYLKIDTFEASDIPIYLDQ